MQIYHRRYCHKKMLSQELYQCVITSKVTYVRFCYKEKHDLELILAVSHKLHPTVTETGT